MEQRKLSMRDGLQRWAPLSKESTNQLLSRHEYFLFWSLLKYLSEGNPDPVFPLLFSFVKTSD